MRKTVAQYITETFVERGVNLVFGMPGDNISDFYPALAATSIRHITVKHENNGAVMADVYGRVSGKPGILITEAGPGATNALTGIAGAYNAASPLIHISGSVNRGAKREGFHGSRSENYLQKVFEPVTKWSLRLERVDQLPRVVSQAFELSTSAKPGPVHIEIPWEFFKAGPVEMEDSPTEEKADMKERNLPILTSMVKALEEASYPVIYAGKGIKALRGQDALRRFAEAAGIPVITPRTTSDLFPEDHPLFAGLVGDVLAHPLANQILAKTDVLLAVGFSADTEDLEIVHRSQKLKLLFIGFDDFDSIDSGAEMGLVTDCRWALERMLSMVKPARRSWDSHISRWMEAYKRRVDGWVEGYRFSKPLHFGVALKELAPFLGPDSLVITDVGNHRILSRILLPLYSKASILLVGTYNAMGFAIPGSIAAKLARPERRVVGITGDGCFLISCSDFLTAVEQKLPLVIVVLNDSHYGMIRYLQRKRYGHSYFSEVGTVDFVKFAQSCGGVGFRVEEDSELRTAFHSAFSSESPAVVEIMSGPDFPYPPMEE